MLNLRLARETLILSVVKMSGKQKINNNQTTNQLTT